MDRYVDIFLGVPVQAFGLPAVASCSILRKTTLLLFAHLIALLKRRYFLINFHHRHLDEEEMKNGVEYANQLCNFCFYCLQEITLLL